MGSTNLSPISAILPQELENLDAMKALKSYARNLDSKEIPLLFAQVSENKDTPGWEYTIISLCEVLARAHGSKIAPHIDSIMTTIIQILTSSSVGGSTLALHQACSKLVPAIARYGIDPTTPEEKKRHIIHSLCKPLSDSLLGSQASGSALCLKALVDSDNWRFASSEMVNEVCQRAAGALDNPTQSTSHVAIGLLVVALARHNSLIVEPYARLLIQSGLKVLNAGVAEGHSQKCLSTIQMVNFLMKCLDPRSVSSELRLIIEEMENCQSYSTTYLKRAAFEALQTARRIARENGLKVDCDMGSVTGSNFGRRANNWRRNLYGNGDQSHLDASAESWVVNSRHDSLIDSPISSSEASEKFNYDQRNVNQKLWSHDNGGVGMSNKHGLHAEVSCGSTTENSESDEVFTGDGDYTCRFASLFRESPRNKVPISTTTSLQRHHSHLNADDINIYTTPRKLVCSLQGSNNNGNDFSGKQTRMFRMPPTSKSEWNPASDYNQNSLSPNMNYEVEKEEVVPAGGEEFQVGSESVWSTEDVPTKADSQVSQKVVPGSRIVTQSIRIQNINHKSTVNRVCAVFVLLFALFICILWIDDQDESYILVPT